MKWWTTREIKLLREQYPIGGADAVWEALNEKRSIATIHNKARKLNLIYTGPSKGRTPRASTPAIDKALRAGVPLGEVSRLFGLTEKWIRAQQRRLGITYERKPHIPWTAEEDDILRETKGDSVEGAQLALWTTGKFKRTLNAIRTRRAQLGVGNTREYEGYVTHSELSELLGYCKTDAIVRWTSLRHDPLKERVTGQVRRIRESEFRRWLIRNPMRVDLSKMPSTSNPWFIELLTGQAPKPLEPRSPDVSTSS